MPIDGKWYNELGSWMILRLGPDGRSLTGTYHSAVGQAVQEYSLVGRVDSAPAKSQGLGWVVAWENDQLDSHSVTTWSGQFRVVNGEEFITTTWLLTREGAPADEWESTLVGKDTFARTAPTAEHVTKVRAMRGLRALA